MSGFLSVIEIAVTGGLLAEQIAGEVLKGQLKNIIDDHQEQFKMIREMNDIIKILLDQQSLTSQLATTDLYSTKNWEFINENMQKKKQMAQAILENFKDISSAPYGFTAKDGIYMGLTAVGAVYMLYNFFSGEKPGIQQLKIDAKKVKEWCQKRCKNSNPEIVNASE